MTSIHLVGLFLCFSLLFAAHLYFNQSLILKIATVSFLFLISSVIYFSFETFKGWSTRAQLSEGQLVFAMAFDPTPTDAGAIFAWVLPKHQELGWMEKIMTYVNGDGVEPRSFKLPYSKDSAKEYEDAVAAIKKGYVVMIKKNSGESDDDSADGDEGKSSSGGNGDVNHYQVPHLEILPPDRMLRK